METFPYTPGVVVHTIHSAITADAESEAILIAGTRAVAIVLTEAGTVNNREADLTVDTSVDGSTFDDYNMLIDNVTNANDKQITRVATKNIAAAGTHTLWMTPETLGGLTHIKVDMAITDTAAPTGNFTVKVAVFF